MKLLFPSNVHNEDNKDTFLTKALIVNRNLFEAYNFSQIDNLINYTVWDSLSGREWKATVFK